MTSFVSICSYVVDVTCRTAKAFFSNDEWNEIVTMSHFELPQLPLPTLLFLEKLRRSIVSGVHPNYVPLPEPNTMDAKDIMDCILAQKTAAEWCNATFYYATHVYRFCRWLLLIFLSIPQVSSIPQGAFAIHHWRPIWSMVGSFARLSSWPAFHLYGRRRKSKTRQCS